MTNFNFPAARVLILLFLITSCNTDGTKSKIIGKWSKTEKSVKTGDDNLFELTLDKNGDYMKISFKGSAVEYTTVGKYEIKEDSIIFYKNKNREDWGKIVKCDEENLVIQKPENDTDRYEKVKTK